MSNPLIYTDTELEQLEHRLDAFPDAALDPSVVRKLLTTAIRARRCLANLRQGPVNRTLPRSRAMIDFGLGETEREGVAGC